jgi:hypothetical protein
MTVAAGVARRTLIVAAGLLLAPLSQANVFVEDHRVQRNPGLPVLRSVGVLHHPNVGVGGTAFLVSRCHIATAHHVVFVPEGAKGAEESETLRGRLGRSTEFLIGLDPAVPGRFASRTRATVVAFGNFSRTEFAGMAGDWAILRLDDCLGAKYGFLALARPDRESPMPKRALMTAGFPKSRAAQAGITTERGCKARDYGPVPDLFGVDCAFESGMSGGPVLEVQADGSWRVVGLIQQSMAPAGKVLPAYSMEHRNQAVAASAFAPALERVLRADSKRTMERHAK